MNLHRRRFLQGTGALFLSTALPPAALSEPSPSTAVRVLVGFPQDGPVDIAARLMCPWLSDHLAKPFVVENLPGESGNTATGEALASKPDGSTLLVCGPVNCINATLFPALPFNFGRDIEPIASFFRVPLVVEINPSVPARNVSEFLSLARRHPGELKVAYAGKGTPQHIAIELFNKMAGVTLSAQSYTGSAAALQAVLGGVAQVMFDPLPSSIELVRAGSLVPLATTGASRPESLADVPLMSSFVPGYEAGSWFGLVAPRATPAEMVALLNREVNSALRDPAIQARISKLGGTVMPGSSAEFGSFIASEIERYSSVIRHAKIAAGISDVFSGYTAGSGHGATCTSYCG